MIILFLALNQCHQILYLVFRKDFSKYPNFKIGGGGVSIYYSHTMQLLFFSYANGKSFMAPLKSVAEEIETIFPISVLKTTSSSTSSSSSSSTKNGAQPLCQWSEIVGHPGLVTAFLQSSNNPVILMVKPETICAQVLML